MSYRDHDYMSPTGTHPVGAHGKAGGSGWGAVIVIAFLVGLLGLAIVFGPEAEQAGVGGEMPAMEQSAPAAGGDMAPAPAQPMD